MGCGASSGTVKEKEEEQGKSPEGGGTPGGGDGASTAVQNTRHFSPQEAVRIFNEHKDKFGRCAYTDQGASADKNTLRGMWTCLRVAMPSDHFAQCTLAGTNGNIAEGLIALLLERASAFASSGAEGMQAVADCLYMACKLVIEVNAAMRVEAGQEEVLRILGSSEKLKEAWTLKIKEIRKKCKTLPVSQRKHIPLFYLDAKLSQLEIAVTAIRDPQAKQKALFAAFNIGKSIVLSVAMMKVEENLVSNLCTGFNLAVESRIQVNAERNFIVLLGLMQCQHKLRKRVYAAAGSTAGVLATAREMQAIFQQDPSQENAIYFAECLAQTVIGTSDQNYSHLHKDVILLLVRGEQERNNGPESSTVEEQGDHTFGGLLGLAIHGTGNEDSKGGAIYLKRLKILMDEVLQGVLQGKSFDLGDTIAELLEMIEPEVLNALQDSVARGRDVVEACAESKLADFERACIDVLEEMRSSKGGPFKDKKVDHNSKPTGVKRSASQVSSIAHLDDHEKKLVKAIEKAGRHADEFIGRLKAGMKFVDTLITLLENSVGTALVLVENAINMLQMLVKLIDAFGGNDSSAVEQMVKDMAGKKSYVAQELKKMLIAKLRPKLEPCLTKAGVAWEEALPVLEATTVEILKQCVNTGSVDPVMEELGKASEPLMKQYLIGKLRPLLEHRLTQHGLEWENALPVLETITVDLLKKCADPIKPVSIDRIMEELLKTSGPIALKFALAKMRPLLKPYLETAKLDGAAWKDVVWAIASEITMEDAKTCLDTKQVGLIVEKLTSERVVKRIAIARLRTTLELRLTRNGVTWDEAVLALEAITLELLKECAGTGSIEPIVEKLAEETSGPIAWKFTLAKTRQMLLPRLPEVKMKGAAWNDVVSVIAASGITIAEVRNCVQKQDVELLVQKLAQSDTRTETVAGAKMGTDDCDQNGAPASDTLDLTSAWNANLDVRGAITVAGANMGTDGIDSLPSTDARESILECLVALHHVKSALESVADVARVAKSIQQEAVTAVKVADSLVNGFSSLLEEATRAHVSSDAGKVDELVRYVKFLSGFVREKVVGTAVRVEDMSTIFGTAMNFFRCSAPVDIDFGDDLAGKLTTASATVSFPSKITVQATGETDPVSGKLHYASSCSRYSVCWDKRGWVIRSAEALGNEVSIVLSGSGYEDGLTADEWKVRAFRSGKPLNITETVSNACTTFRDVSPSFGSESVSKLKDTAKQTLEQEVGELLSSAKFALQDKLHQVCMQAEERAEGLLAAAEDALGVDMDEVEESVGALSACFAPVKKLVGSVVQNVLSRRETWRARAIAIFQLMLVKSALERDLDAKSCGKLAPQARKEMAKAVGKILMERKALETERRVLKAFDTGAFATEAASFWLDSWKDPDDELDEAVDKMEQLELEILNTSEPAEKSRLEKLRMQQRKVAEKRGSKAMVAMLQKMQSRIIDMHLNMPKAAGADTTNKLDWEEAEETVQDCLRQRIDAVSRLQEQMDEEDNRMEQELLLMQCRQEQVEIRQQLRNVQGIGQSLGIIISFLDGMQSQLTSINAKLDKIAADVQRLENRVAGRPPAEHIRLVLEDTEERSNAIPDTVFIPTEALCRCEHVGDPQQHATRRKGGELVCKECDPFTESSRNKPQLLLPLLSDFLGGGERGCHAFAYISKRQSGEADDGAPSNKEGAAAGAKENPNGLHTLGSVLIHGPAGSGKSLFAKEAYRYLLQHRHFLRDVYGEDLLLVYITLPAMTNPLTDLFAEGLRRQYDLRDSQIAELKEKIRDPNSKLRVVFMLDGHDELPPDVRSKNLFKTNNLETLRPQTSTKESYKWPKIITLCRSEFLSEQEDGEYQQLFLPLEFMNTEKDEVDEAAKFFAEFKLTRFDKKLEAYLRRSVAIDVRKKFEDVCGGLPKPKPGDDKVVKSILLDDLDASIAMYKDGKSEAEVLQSKGTMLLSPRQLEEVRLSVCLVAQGDGEISTHEYDRKLAEFFKAHKPRTDVGQINFDDTDANDERYLVAMIRLLRRVQEGMHSAATNMQQVSDAARPQASGLKWKRVDTEPPNGQVLEKPKLKDALAGKMQFTQEEWDKFGIKDLSVGHFIKVKEGSYFTPAADQETGEQGGDKTDPAATNMQQVSDAARPQASGLKWKLADTEPPNGQVLEEPKLKDALAGKMEFTQEEWDKFEIKDLSMGHFIKVKEDSYFTPAADQETDEQRGDKTAQTRTEDAKVLAKLAKAEVWSVFRTLFRLGKVEGLDDLKDTPFMVKLILGILPNLNKLSASPSTVKQNLILLCSNEDEAEAAMSNLQKGKITSTSKELEAFQQMLSKDEGACMVQLEEIADAVVKDLKAKAEKVPEIKGGGPVRQEQQAFEKERLVRILLSALRRRPLSRSIIYTVFTVMYMEAKARDKQTYASTSLTPAQLQREARLLCERLAMTMTKENKTKIEYANGSLVFTDSADPFSEFFGTGRADAALVELVLTCCPLTKSQGICSFMHKSVQEFFAALGVLQHLEALCTSCKSDAKDILHVLDLLDTSSSDVEIPVGLNLKEKEEHMMKMVNVTSWGKGKPRAVAARMRMAQDLMKLAQGIKTSALAVFDVEQEEGVRDFLVDMLLSNPAYRSALRLIARFCASRIGSTSEMVRENIWTVLTMANPKREGGSLLHVACREGNLPLLRTALSIMRDCSCYHERLADVEVSPLLLRGTSKFKTIPVIAAALYGHRDCVEELLRFVEGVSGLQWKKAAPQGAAKPTVGRDLTTGVWPNVHALAEKLEKGDTKYTQDEWDAFGISSVRISDFIKVGECYFQPVATTSEETSLHGVAVQDHKSATEAKALLQTASFITAWKEQVYTLNWRDSRLNDADAQMVAQVLECLPGLCRLDLSGNKIGAPGCLSLGKKLAFAKSLQHLNMSENPIGAEGCQFLVKPQEVGTLHKVAEEMAVDMSVPGLIKEEFCAEFMEDYGSAFDESIKLFKLRDEIWGHYFDLSSQEKEGSNLEEHMYGYILETLKRDFKEKMSTIVPRDGEDDKKEQMQDKQPAQNPQGLEGAVSLQELNLSGCGVGPEGSRAVATVLHCFPALARLHIHDAVGEEVQGTMIGPADGHVVVKGCLVPLPDTQGGEQAMLELNLRRLHAHVPSLLAECKKAEGATTPDMQEAATRLESRLEQALSLSYCAAKAAAGASIDLLQELSDATEVCPESSILRELKTLVSRSRALLHKQKGRSAAQLMLQLASQEPVATGLPAQVQALRWEDLEQGVPRRDGSPAQSGLFIEDVNRPEQRSDAVLLTVAEHTDIVNGVKVLPGGKLLASVSEDGDVLICSMATGEVKCTLAGHNDKRLHGCICGGQDVERGVANEDCPLLHEATGGHVGGVTCLDVSRTGKLLVTGGTDRTVRVWKREGRSSRYTLWKQSSPGHAKEVKSVSIHGRRIASGSEDGTVKVWAPTGRGAGLSCQQTLKVDNRVNSIAYSPDGSKLAAAHSETVSIFNMETNEVQCTVNVGGVVSSVSFSMDGSKISAAFNVYDYNCAFQNGGVKIFSNQGSAGFVCQSTLRGENAIFSLAFSPDGQLIATGEGNPYNSREEGAVRIYCASTGQVKRALTGHTGGVMGVSFDPTGKKIVSCSQDKTIRFWDSATGAAIGSPVRGHTGPVRSVCFSPDGSKIVSGSEDETVLVWDAASGEQMCSLRGHTDFVTSVCFSPDGSKIVSGSEDRTVLIWDAASGEQLCSLRGHSERINSVAFSPDGQFIASCSGEFWNRDNSVRVWNVETGEQLCQLRGHSASVNCVDFSPDGLTIASGSGSRYENDNSVRVWDVKTGKQLWQLRGHTDHVWSVCFSPDGSKIVSGSEDKTILVWDAASGEQLCSLSGHRAAVKSVEFANDNTLISADSSGKTKVWNIATGEETTEALAGSKFALSKQGKDKHKQQVGRFVCTAEGDLLLIHLLQAEDDAKGGARRPIAFFRAPSPIDALDCQGAEIALGCQSGAVLLLRAAVLLM